MMLLFGWYSFVLRSFTPQQLGIDDPLARDLTFEVREKCAYFFFIPCFSLGKMYVSRRHDLKFDLPPQYIGRITALGPFKTPWYCFTFPILLVLALVGFSISASMEKAAEKKLHKEKFELKMADAESMLNSLTPNHFIKLEPPHYYYSNSDPYLKVASVKGNDVTCLLFNYYTPDNKFSTYDLFTSLRMYESQLDSITFSKADLSKYIPRDFDRYEKREMNAGKLFGNDSLYYIEDIIDASGPYIVPGHSSSQGPGRLEFQLQNIGFGAELTAIETLEGNISWNAGEPVYLPGGDSKKNRFYVKGSGSTRDTPYKLLLHFKDSTDITYMYSITGKNHEKRIRRVVGMNK